MKRILLLLAVSAIAFGLVVLPNPIADQMPADGMATASLNIDADVSADNKESATYTLVLTNPTNKTVSFTIPINFNYPPESLSLKRDGKEVELAAQAQLPYQVSYAENILLEPSEEVTYTLSYRVLRTPNEYGIWALKYGYNPPLSYFNANADNQYLQVRTHYTGEVRFEYPISNVICGGCTPAGNKIQIDSTDYFNLNWEKARTPYRAGIFYLLLLAGLLLSIAAARRARTTAGKKR